MVALRPRISTNTASTATPARLAMMPPRIPFAPTPWPTRTRQPTSISSSSPTRRFSRQGPVGIPRACDRRTAKRFRADVVGCQGRHPSAVVLWRACRCRRRVSDAGAFHVLAGLDDRASARQRGGDLAAIQSRRTSSSFGPIHTPYEDPPFKLRPHAPRQFPKDALFHPSVQLYLTGIAAYQPVSLGPVLTGRQLNAKFVRRVGPSSKPRGCGDFRMNQAVRNEKPGDRPGRAECPTRKHIRPPVNVRARPGSRPPAAPPRRRRQERRGARTVGCRVVAVSTPSVRNTAADMLALATRKTHSPRGVVRERRIGPLCD